MLSVVQIDIHSAYKGNYKHKLCFHSVCDQRGDNNWAVESIDTEICVVISTDIIESGQNARYKGMQNDIAN